MVLYYIVILLLIPYSFIVLYFGYVWQHIPIFSLDQQQGTTAFSVIIPARNEEQGLPELLRALEHQQYPRHLYEVIVVNDHSTDQTAAVVGRFGATRLINLQDHGINSYKKKAVETGIIAAANPWIVCTDADCIPGPRWLAALAQLIEKKNPVFIAAPVCINNNRSLVQLFQAADFMVLQGITGAAVHGNQLSMCNGANLAYRKDAFEKVNGFSGIDSIASGDDMLLMHKIAQQYPGGIAYLKTEDGIVQTAPVTSWRGFFNQRIRWASKATHYKDRRIFGVLLLVYLFNLCFPALAIAGFWDRWYWIALLALWVIKTLVELPLFSSAASFFSRRWMIPYFILLQPMHVIYTLVSGFLGVAGTYEWKGRRVR